MRRWLVLFVMCMGVAGAAPVAAPTGPLAPRIEPARGGQCVADPATMRREHMTMLKHQRDETVRAGVRGAPVSLKTCVECHASRTTGSVAAASTDFCVSCHSYAAVKIDCFQCHASKPQGTAFHPLADTHHGGDGARLAARLRRMNTAQKASP